MLRGLSIGKSPSKLGRRMGSINLSRSFGNPRCSAMSWNRILMKIRLLEVVSSSFKWIIDRTCQPIASLLRICPKKRAILRRRFVSYR